HLLIFTKVCEILERLRRAGLPVNVLVTHNIIIGVIRQINPEILETIQNRQTRATFKISLSIVQRYLSGTLKWSYCASTKAS
ncbi:hypothetical protein HOY80DRAFT_856738, partial [Tuber brumale]